MEALGSARKLNTIPGKQHNFLNNKIKNYKTLTYKINPTTECWLRGTTKIYLCPLITYKWTNNTRM
jgi:hypothetical protein